MKRLSLLATCLLFVAGGLFLGCENQIEAPAEMTLQTRSAIEVLPADVQFVGMVNLEAMQQNSAFNPFDEMDMGSEFGARIQDFIDATGFNPETDLNEVYFAADNMRDHHAKPNFVAYANFDRARLLDYIEQNFSGEFARADYKGVTIYRATDDDFAFALATDNMMVASADEAAVEAMLDRLAGQGRALNENAETMKLIESASGNSSAWFVMRDIDAEMDADHGDSDEAIERDMVQIGRALQDVAVSVTMQDDGAEGRAILKTKDGVSTDDVASLIKGVIAAMKGSAKVDSDELQMLDRARVRAQGDQVHVSFFVDNNMLASVK